MGERIRRISVSFTEDEFNRLKEVKIETGLSWHDLLLEMLEVFTKNRNPGIPEIAPEKKWTTHSEARGITLLGGEN